MEFLKKQTAGTYITFLAFILSIVSVIIYNVNINAAGYFQNATVAGALTCNLVGIVILLVILALAQLPAKGIAGLVLTLINDALRIIAPVIFIVALMQLLSARVEGFAFIYFSNEEVLHEVQTAENMASTHGTIANMVFLGLTAILAIVAAFFSTKKETAPKLEVVES